MELYVFIIIWVVVFISLISFLPGILYFLSLIFNLFKPPKKVRKNIHYSLKQMKEVKGKIK